MSAGQIFLHKKVSVNVDNRKIMVRQSFGTPITVVKTFELTKFSISNTDLQ